MNVQVVAKVVFNHSLCLHFSLYLPHAIRAFRMYEVHFYVDMPVQGPPNKRMYTVLPIFFLSFILCLSSVSFIHSFSSLLPVEYANQRDLVIQFNRRCELTNEEKWSWTLEWVERKKLRHEWICPLWDANEWRGFLALRLASNGKKNLLIAANA